MTNVVNQFTSINPEDIPIDRIQDYKEALDFLNTRTPFYGNMNEIFDEMLSYKVAEKFDAVKTKDALMDKYKSIMANEVKTVEDYVALIKDLNAFKRKAFQLLQNDAITQEEYDDLINGAGETQADKEGLDC
jgi:chromosome condensin MukBEF complex kleisin-like MukF subunit